MNCQRIPQTNLHNVQQRRLSLGMTREQCERVAKLDSFDDVEDFADEAATVLPLRDLVNLMAILGMRSADFFDRTGSGGSECGFAQLGQSLASYLRNTGRPLSDVEDEIGWHLRPLVEDPAAVWGYTLQPLVALCELLRCSWSNALDAAVESSETKAAEPE